MTPWLSGEAEGPCSSIGGYAERSACISGACSSSVAELATVRKCRTSAMPVGERLNSVFFLATNPTNTDGLLWVGPGSKDAFDKYNSTSEVGSGTSKIRTSRRRSRNVSRRCEVARRKKCLSGPLGSWRQASPAQYWPVVFSWFGAACSCSVLSSLYWSARRTLHGVERITETVAAKSEPRT